MNYVKLLEQEISEKGAKKVMKTNLHGFTRTTHFRLKSKVEYLKRYFGWPYNESAEDKVRDIMRNHFEVLASMNLSQLKQTLQAQERYLGKGNISNGKIITRRILLNHFPKVTPITTHSRLRRIEGLLERAKGREATIKFVADHFDRIIDLDTEILEANMNTIEEFLGEQVLQRISWNDLLELADTDGEKLQEDLVFVRDKKGMRAFINLSQSFSLEKLQYLREGIRKTRRPRTPVKNCSQLTFDFAG